MNKGICTLQLKSINEVDDDPTLLKAVFSILDFGESGNKQIVPKEVALNGATTLKLKPLLCQYFPSTNYEDPNDHFGSHGEYIGIDRYGNDDLKTDSFAVGVANEGGYLGTVMNDDNEEVEVLMCDFYLWKYRYPDICDLIIEMNNEGLPLYSSCEYYYKNFEVNEGVEILKDPIVFDGHCLLRSGEGGTTSINPAYKTSKLISINERWNKAVAQVIKSKNEKEDDDVNKDSKLFKKLCELSFSDTERLLYDAVDEVVADEDYVWFWICDTYNDHFVISYHADDKTTYFDVSYSKSDEKVVIDWENRTEVYLYKEWKEIPEVQQAMNELEEAKKNAEEELKKVNNNVSTLAAEKESLEEKFNDASEKLTSLNEKVQDMQGIVDTYKNEQYEKAINEKMEYYEKKFNAVGAKDKFAEEDVQELIKTSINDDEDGKDAVLKLNSMLVDLVAIKEEDEEEHRSINEMPSSNREKLVDTKKDFESRYGE